METKVCVSCLVEKSVDDFYLKKNIRECVCKACRYKLKVMKYGKKERTVRIKGYKVYKKIVGIDGICRKVCPSCMKIKRVDTEYPQEPKIRFCNECINKKNEEKKESEADIFAKDCVNLLENIVVFLTEYREKNNASDRVLVAVLSDILIEIIYKQNNPEACLNHFKLMLDNVFIKNHEQINR